MLYQSEATYGAQTNFTFSDAGVGDDDVYYDFHRNDTVVGLWYFDEGSGQHVADESGHGNNGTMFNNPSWVAGKYGQAILFSWGDPDYVNVTHNPSVTPEIVSVEAWVKITTFGSWSRIMLKDPWPDHSYGLLLGDNNNVGFLNRAAMIF